MSALETISHVLKNDKTWTVLSAVSGMVAATAALFTVRLLINARTEELERKRPYFTISKPGIKPLANSPFLRCEITWENTGIHVAQNINTIVYFIDSALKSPPDYSIECSIANDVPPNSPTPWYNDSLKLSPNMPKKYIVAVIEYEDQILKNKYSQRFYMKWSGVANGVTHPDFTHVNVEEKEKIIRHLEQHCKASKEQKRLLTPF